MNKIKHIFSIFILAISFVNVNSQTTIPFSIGVGGNSSIYFYNYDHYAFPALPITPYLTFKIKRHEILVGPDMYPYLKNKIIGAQAGYKYHFLKENKPFHFFIDANFQHVAFIFGCGPAQNYNTERPSVCIDGITYKTKSFVNTYGIGLERKFFNRASLYAILGAGYNYYEIDIYRNLAGYSPIKNGTHTSFISYFRIGLSLDIYKKKKSEACYGALPKK